MGGTFFNILMSGRGSGNYTLLPYLEGTGTQYINLGSTFGGQSIVAVKFSTTAVSDFIFGGRNAASDGFAVFTYGANALRFMYANQFAIDAAVAVSDGSPHVVEMNANNFRVDDEPAASATAASFTTPEAVLFGARTDTNIDQRLFTGKIFYFRMQNPGGPEVYLTPALRKSDQKPGMLNQNTGEFYTNFGSGEFLYPQEG